MTTTPSDIFKIRLLKLSSHLLSELMAAIDRTLNGKYIAVVIGDRDSVYSNSALLKDFRHMASLTHRQKQQILRNLKTGGNMLCYCIEFDIPTLLILADKRLAAFKVPKHPRVSDSIGYEMKQTVQKYYVDFLAKNGKTIHDIEFEADDSDVIEFLRKGGLSHRKPGLTHKIADCIVHANGKRWVVNPMVKESPNGFTKQFHDRTLNRIYR